MKNPKVFIWSRSLSTASNSEASLPETDSRKPGNKALCVVAKYTLEISTQITYPKINTPDEIIIRARSVGLNPIDYKSIDYNFCMPSIPWIGGREVAGTVEEVGSNVTRFKTEDRVWASKSAASDSFSLY